MTAPEHHDELLGAILARYLHESPDEQEVPRFLLNDVIRYWRTVAVDYQAKRWDELVGKKWGLRYAKLVSTRKLTYASTLASLFWPALNNQAVTVEALREQFTMPPLARLAQLVDVVDDQTKIRLADVLRLADQVNGMLRDKTIRPALAGASDPRSEPEGSPMHTMRIAAREMQDSLQGLFFRGQSSLDLPHCLESLSLKYLGF